MYLMLYQEEIYDLKKEKEILNQKIDILENLVQEQEELIYNLKQIYNKVPDDSEGEASDFYSYS